MEAPTKVSVSKKYTNGVCGSIRSLEDVIVRMVRHHHAAGNIAYPDNIPAGFVPFQICLDAGAGTTKVILKLNIVKNSDSVKNLVLLAILSKAKDTYAAMAVAFKSIALMTSTASIHMGSGLRLGGGQPCRLITRSS